MPTTVFATLGTSLLIILIAAWITVRCGSWRTFAAGGASVVACTAIAIWLYSKRPVPESLPYALPASVGDIGGDRSADENGP